MGVITKVISFNIFSCLQLLRDMRIGDLFLSVAKLQAANNIMANCLHSELKEMLNFQLDISENRSAIFFPKQAHKLLEIHCDPCQRSQRSSPIYKIATGILTCFNV